MKIGIYNINDIEDGVVSKKWGSETIIHNDEDYCGKILKFNKGAEFSMHFHLKKSETWIVTKGQFLLTYIDTDNADGLEVFLNIGDVVEIPQGQPHQLHALDEAEIFEVSTQHFDDDSYRIAKGNSQNG